MDGSHGVMAVLGSQVWRMLEIACDWMTEAIVWTNSHGQIESGNVAFQRLFNGSQPVRGKALSDLLRLSALERFVLHPVEYVLAGQVLPPTPYLFSTSHGVTTHWLELAGSPLYGANGGSQVVGALFVLRTGQPPGPKTGPKTALQQVQRWQSAAALSVSGTHCNGDDQDVDDQTALICRFLPNGTLSFANPAYLRYFGLPDIADATQAGSAAHLVWQTLPADDRQRVISEVAQLSLQHPSRNCEYRVLLPTGEIRWQQWTVHAIFNSEQQIVEYQAVGRDISDRKWAEAALISSEERFRTLVQNASDVIVVMRIDGTSSYVSPSAAGVLGFAAESLLGRDVFASVHPEDLPQAETAFLEAVECPDQTVRVELRVRHPHRGWIDLECTCRSQLHEPSIQGVVINIRDISERKRAEAALRSILQGTASATGEAFFPVLVENLASALEVRHAVVSELKGNQLVTLAFCSAHELQPNLTFELPEVPCCQTVIQQGLFCCQAQVQQHFPDLPILAQLRAESYLGVAMQDDSGRPIGTLCIVDDQPIRDPVRAEAILRIFAARAAAELERQRATTALQQLNHDLEARVTQRTQELIQSQATLQKQTHLLQALLAHMVEDITHRRAVEAQLRASLQEKEVLLKEVHHRVKNNLQMVQSLLNLQARSIEDASVLQALTESQNRVKAMTLVHEKLYQSDSLAKINFSEYVRSLTRDLLHSCVSHLAAIRLSIQVSNIELGVDTAIPCGLIISELFSNAVKYAFSNQPEGTITIKFNPDFQGRYVLIVSDDGIGIPTEVNPHTTKTLGLRLVYALTRQLRGTLELDRTQGSAFKITFAKPS